MSLESQILQLKAKHEALDDAFREFQKIAQGTQDVVCLILKEQREYQGKNDHRFAVLEQSINERFDQQDKRFDQYDKRFDQHDKRFDQHDKRFDKIEDTLIQIVNLLSR